MCRTLAVAVKYIIMVTAVTTSGCCDVTPMWPLIMYRQLIDLMMLTAAGTNVCYQHKCHAGGEMPYEFRRLNCHIKNSAVVLRISRRRGCDSEILQGIFFRSG